MLNDLESLPDDPVELQDMVTLLAREVKSQALFIEKLQHQFPPPAPESIVVMDQRPIIH